MIRLHKAALLCCQDFLIHTQVEFSASEEEAIVDADDNEIAEEEGLFGPPQPVTIDDHS
jgi:hypothetical protein